MITAEWLWNLAAVILVVLIWSVAWRDSPLFHFAENTIVGAAAGYFAVVAIQSLQSSAIIPIYTGRLWLVIPIMLGVLVFSRWSRWPWLYRYPIALVVGSGTALAVRSALQAQFISQIQSTILPIIGTPMVVLNNLVTFIMTVFITQYFFFTTLQKGLGRQIFGYTGRIAKYLLMVTFGVGFVSFFLSAYAFLITSVDFVVRFFRS